VDGWNEGEHLAEATSRAGLSLAEFDASIAADPGGPELSLEQNQCRALGRADTGVSG
jgi:hypothetical protein